MNDQIEATSEVIPPKYEIVLGPTAVYTVVFLASYGAGRLTQDVANKAKQILANRKAKKDAKKVETDPQQ